MCVISIYNFTHSVLHLSAVGNMVVSEIGREFNQEPSTPIHLAGEITGIHVMKAAVCTKSEGIDMDSDFSPEKRAYI